MSDRNERYDSGTGRTLEELEKVYFQKAEPGSSPEPPPQAARANTIASPSMRTNNFFFIMITSGFTINFILQNTTFLICEYLSIYSLLCQ